MRGVTRVILILAILAVALVMLIFILENQQIVSLSFMGWTTSQMPISVFLVVALIAGMLIGPFFGAVLSLKLRKIL